MRKLIYAPSNDSDMGSRAIRPSGYSGVFSDGRRLLTRNLTPGKRVYSEELIAFEDVEYRIWYPRRSKLAALILKGTEVFPFEERSRVLYLGAATGTTSSHISDIANEGVVYCVEVSPRSFRKLVKVCEDRMNMIPILADAGKPERYASQVEDVDVIYQDIAQRDQLSFLLKNLGFLKTGGTVFMMVKARSIDVASNPRDVYKKVRDKVREEGLKLLETVELDPYEKDHAAFIIEY
jgi:fibrillarin-like pre-rRNA processing protein